jgi:hypothetical protein
LDYEVTLTGSSKCRQSEEVLEGLSEPPSQVFRTSTAEARHSRTTCECNMRE